MVELIGKYVLISSSGGIPCLMKPNKFGYLLYTTPEAVECHDSIPADISVGMVTIYCGVHIMVFILQTRSCKIELVLLETSPPASR